MSFLSIVCILLDFYDIPTSCNGYHCWERVLRLISFCLSKSFTNLYFLVISTYFPEILPTPVRGLGLGFIRAIGVSGSIFSPYLV